MKEEMTSSNPCAVTELEINSINYSIKNKRSNNHKNIWDHKTETTSYSIYYKSQSPEKAESRNLNKKHEFSKSGFSEKGPHLVKVKNQIKLTHIAEKVIQNLNK